MPLYRQGNIFTEPRRSGLGATVVGALQGMQKGKELGRKEAQKDIQNIMKNPQLAQYIDKDKLQKQVKRGYGKNSATASALSNALQKGATFGGQEPITKTVGDTLYQFNPKTREWGQVAQEETGTLSNMSDDEILSQYNDLARNYRDVTGKVNIEELKKDPLYPALSKEMKKRDLFSGKRSKINRYKEKYPNRSEEEIIKAMKEKGIL